MGRTRTHRKRVYHRAAAIARDVRTADFPDAVNIIARLIAGPMTRKRHQPLSPDVVDAEPMSDAERELWRRANPQLAASHDVVMVEGTIPVSQALARELVADGTLRYSPRVSRDGGPEVVCDSDCPQARASWPGCCKLVDARDVCEPAGPDSFGGEDGMHSPAAATIRRELEERTRR